MCPQVGKGFNRGAWKQLEDRVRSIASRNIGTHVISGPLYLAEAGASGRRFVTYPVIGNNVAVPTHFFKAIFYKTEETIEGDAYILPNKEIDKNQSLDSFRVSTKKIESLAGVIFDTRAMRDLLKLSVKK